MKKRTRGRELALQLAYQVDLRGAELLEQAEELLRSEEEDKEARRFALRLTRGAWENLDAINDVIQEVAQNWDLSRMAVIDRNVLRLAVFELLYCDDIPPKVSINEAIELGKRYSTQNSGAFINGILDKIKAQYADAAPQTGAAAGSGPSDVSSDEPPSPSQPAPPTANGPAQA